jgi:hypothetical protein
MSTTGPQPVPPTAATAAAVAPRVGGGTCGKTWWTGGSNLGTQTRRASMFACRPEDMKMMYNIEKEMREGIKEESRLGLPTEKAYKITLTGWIDKVKTHIEKCGLDTVFHLFDGKKECYLFDRWGEVSMDQIDDHVEDLITNGVPLPPLANGTRQTGRSPVCQFDIENLDRTREVITASLSQEFYNALGPKLLKGMTGIHLFLLAVSFLEPPTASTARALLTKLQKKELKLTSGMDVNAFNIVVQDLVTRINGCCANKEHLPPDLALVVAQCYQDTEIKEFDMLVITIINQLDADVTKYTTTEILTLLGNKYDRLINTDRWPHKSKIQELAEEVGQLKALQRKAGSEQPSQKSDTGSKRGREKVDDSPKRNTPEGNPALHIPPKEGAPEVMMIDGVEHKFCRKCKNRKHGDKPMWRKDEFAHTTSEHMSLKDWRAKQQANESSGSKDNSKDKDKKEEKPASSISALVAIPPVVCAPPQARLRLMSSLNVLHAAGPDTSRPNQDGIIIDSGCSPMITSTSVGTQYNFCEVHPMVTHPRHFDDDSAGDNCSITSDVSFAGEDFSFASDEDDLTSDHLNFNAGPR